MKSSDQLMDMTSKTKETRKIPSYIKWNDDKDNPRFIPDGMNAFERNTKRIGDCMIAGSAVRANILASISPTPRMKLT